MSHEYVATVPDLPGCHTQAKSLDDLTERIREAIEPRVEDENQETEPREFVGVLRVSVQV